METAAMAARQRRSKVWLYFTRGGDGDKASCNSCQRIIASKGGNTSNMQKHLATHHTIRLRECHVFDSLRQTSDNNSSCSAANRNSATSGEESIGSRTSWK